MKFILFYFILSSSEIIISHFENLSNELFYEIFEYMDYFHVYQAFSNLNQRFENLINDSTLSIKINISLISKSKFKCYNGHVLQPNIHRIGSLRLSDVFMYDYILSSIPKLSEFQQLQTLILYDIESKYLEDILNQLYSLSSLSSLVISSIDHMKNKNTIYRQIFNLSVLKYCKLSLLGWDSESTLSMCTNKYSSIEYLIIMNDVRYDQLHSLLPYVPQLRRLSIHSPRINYTEQETAYPSLAINLMHFSLKISSQTFDSLTQIMRDLCRNVQVLHLTAEGDCLAVTYIDASKWEQLIINHLPNLRVFDIYIKWFMCSGTDRLRIDSQINQFTSSFWTERQWFFSYQFLSTKHSSYVLFYSTNPYRY